MSSPTESGWYAVVSRYGYYEIDWWDDAGDEYGPLGWRTDHFPIRWRGPIDPKELLHGTQPSGVPDRPGWWRCRIDDRDGWRQGVVEVFYHEDDELGNPVFCFIDSGSRLRGRIFVTDPGVSWYGRVEMPGEK